MAAGVPSCMLKNRQAADLSKLDDVTVARNFALLQAPRDLSRGSRELTYEPCSTSLGPSSSRWGTRDQDLSAITVDATSMQA